jgi:hypothetical protein
MSRKVVLGKYTEKILSSFNLSNKNHRLKARATGLRDRSNSEYVPGFVDDGDVPNLIR